MEPEREARHGRLQLQVLYDAMGDREELDEQGQHPDISIVCLGCLIDDHPELGRGLGLAREYGVADLDDDGEWVVDG